MRRVAGDERQREARASRPPTAARPWSSPCPPKNRTARAARAPRPGERTAHDPRHMLQRRVVGVELLDLILREIADASSSPSPPSRRPSARAAPPAAARAWSCRCRCGPAARSGRRDRACRFSRLRIGVSLYPTLAMSSVMSGGRSSLGIGEVERLSDGSFVRVSAIGCIFASIFWRDFAPVSRSRRARSSWRYRIAASRAGPAWLARAASSCAIRSARWRSNAS